MALSYSLAIVLEVLLLVPIFYFVLSRSKMKEIALERRTLTLIGIALFAGATILFLVPKVNLISEYDHTKLTADAWYHYAVTRIWSDTGTIPTDVHPYYSRFPVTYAPQIALHEVTGMSLFDSITVYYLIVGIAGLLIVIGIAKEIIGRQGSDRIIFAGISGIVYSFLQYLNLLFVQQYPIAFGTVVALFCIYSFALIVNKRKRPTIYLCVAGIMLSIAHPFAPILVALLFFVYFVVNNLSAFKQMPYRSLISRRVALFMSLALIISGLTYSTFVATGTFEKGIDWTGRNVGLTIEKLSSELFESTASGVGQSFERRYDAVETIIYPLNWALPASTSVSMLVFFLTRRFRIGDEKLHLLFPLTIVSTIMFILTFAFSFVEFAFSRYFGAFALAFNIPITSFVILRMVKIRMAIIRYAVLSVMGLAIISSVTDPTMLPNISDSTTIYRSAGIYPTELDVVAWNDFYSSLGDDHKIIQTNVHAGPIRHYKETLDYHNEIIVNPRNYTGFTDNTYLIIDKDKQGLEPRSHQDPFLDRVYDNSQIYFGSSIHK